MTNRDIQYVTIRVPVDMAVDVTSPTMRVDTSYKRREAQAMARVVNALRKKVVGVNFGTGKGMQHLAGLLADAIEQLEVGAEYANRQAEERLTNSAESNGAKPAKGRRPKAKAQS